MSTMYGAGHVPNLTGALVDKRTGAVYNGKVNLQGVRIRLAGDLTETRNQSGETSGLEYKGDYLEAEFDVLPEGATLANTAAGCQLPPRGTAFDAKDFGTAKIPIGPFTDSGICSNSGNTVTNVTDTQPWFFNEGGLDLSSTEQWKAAWTMRRYYAITNGTAIS